MKKMERGWSSLYYCEFQTLKGALHPWSRHYRARPVHSNQSYQEILNNILYVSVPDLRLGIVKFLASFCISSAREKS
jgi:hypothetical protein